MPTESVSRPITEQRPTFRQRVFAHRLWIGLAVVGGAVFIVRPRALFGEYEAAGVSISVALIVIGLALRTWAGGCAGEHTRDATIDAPRLVTGGPFAYVRNPIYLASVVLGLGMVLLIGDPWLLAPYAAVFAFLYGAIVPAEEEFLRNKFGPAYERYCAHVPRAWPRWRAWADAAPARFDSRALLGELRLALVLAGIYALLRLAAGLRS